MAQLNICSHKTCARIRKTGATEAGFVLCQDRTDKGKAFRAVLLGKELRGMYAGQYNLSKFKLIAEDKGCFIAACIRRMDAEFKIKIPIGADFKSVFGTPTKYVMVNDAPFFVGLINSIRSTNYIVVSIQNSLIAQANKDSKLSKEHKEIEHIQSFCYQKHSVTDLHGKPALISSLAQKVMHAVKLAEINGTSGLV